MIAGDPIEQTRKVLRRLVVRIGARGGAVLCPLRADFRILVATNLGLKRFATIQRLWNAHHATLSVGRSHAEDDLDLAPLFDDRCLIGALYVEGASRDRSSISEYLEVLAKAVLAATRHPCLVYDPGSSGAGGDSPRSTPVQMPKPSMLSRLRSQLVAVARLLLFARERSGDDLRERART